MSLFLLMLLLSSSLVGSQNFMMFLCTVIMKKDTDLHNNPRTEDNRFFRIICACVCLRFLVYATFFNYKSLCLNINPLRECMPGS